MMAPICPQEADLEDTNREVGDLRVQRRPIDDYVGCLLSGLILADTEGIRGSGMLTEEKSLSRGI